MRKFNTIDEYICSVHVLAELLLPLQLAYYDIIPILMGETVPWCTLVVASLR